MLHGAHNDFQQKLLIRVFFAGRYSIHNIWKPENANRQIKMFFGTYF